SVIQTGEIGEDFAYYFTVSEQIPSAVGVGVLVGEDNQIISSGGFILQIMPGCSEENIARIEEVIKNLPPVSSLVEKGYTPEDIMNVVSQGEYQHLETLDLQYKCNCKKEKFEKGLISLGKDQLMEIKEVDHHIETVCHFCNTKYDFDENDLDRLINESK
ncbi:MAG: Hsp33 family molecular chaperone HslO, partial [Firmicutes bacterium]|nr:Hsp33 family molecular chaperone HslO [Bacillota bacterium]